MLHSDVTLSNKLQLVMCLRRITLSLYQHQKTLMLNFVLKDLGAGIFMLQIHFDL